MFQATKKEYVKEILALNEENSRLIHTGKKNIIAIENLTEELNHRACMCSANHIVIPSSEITAEKYRNYPIVTRYNEDVVELVEIPHVGNSKVKKPFVVSKSFVVLSQFESDILVDLRKQVEIGIENYPKFDELQKQVEKVLCDRVKEEEDNKEFRAEALRNREFISFIATQISQNKLDQLEQEFDRLRKVKKND